MVRPGGQPPASARIVCVLSSGPVAICKHLRFSVTGERAENADGAVEGSDMQMAENAESCMWCRLVGQGELPARLRLLAVESYADRQQQPSQE